MLVSSEKESSLAAVPAKLGVHSSRKLTPSQLQQCSAQNEVRIQNKKFPLISVFISFAREDVLQGNQTSLSAPEHVCALFHQ